MRTFTTVSSAERVMMPAALYFSKHFFLECLKPGFQLVALCGGLALLLLDLFPAQPFVSCSSWRCSCPENSTQTQNSPPFSAGRAVLQSAAAEKYRKNAPAQKYSLHPRRFCCIVFMHGSATSGRAWRTAIHHTPVISAITTQHSRTKRLRRSLIIPQAPSFLQGESKLWRKFPVFLR